MRLTRMPMSKRDFDCMLSVYRLSSRGWPARVKDVAAQMKVRPPTAVGFLDKLAGLSLVEKGPTGYRPSDKGVILVDEATRAHRLLETLFSKVGIPIEEACGISSSIDRHIDVKALAKVCSHLSHPDKCPHGMPIPAGDKYD
ncbi:MAG: metal-dependent transcriptional regulator [Nitrososphaerales archaeon]|nr:metal-dependent transcriptional regulator [Nitrososphaerales archaeon]